MDHHGAGLGNNDTDGTLGYTILPLGTNSTKSNGLDILDDFLYEPLTFEGTVVSMIRLNGNT